jgi:phosphoglycolate phosphatase-like HAD superfamily hydrolase
MSAFVFNGPQFHRRMNFFSAMRKQPVKPKTNNTIKSIRNIMAVLAITFASLTLARAADPLPSWNDGAAKKSIVEFVAKITKEGSPDFVPAPEHIATFDNDGTLWCEQPMYVQLAFALDRIKVLAPQHPEWKDQEPFKAVLDGDMKAVAASGVKGMLQITEATHSGITTDEFQQILSDWLKTAQHPKYQRLYTDLVYQPMLELLSYLRDNGFKTFIVTGGGIEFVRAFAEQRYGIPPEQVVGSYGELEPQMKEGKLVLMKMPKVGFIDDGPGKPVGISNFIGRRPIFAFGNSDGDQEMLEYTTAGDGPRFAGLVHHTDAEREFAYDRDSHMGKLDKAWDEARQKGWTVVDMKNDWKSVFPSSR